MQPGELARRLRRGICANTPGSQNRPLDEFERVDRELRRDQHGVEARTAASWRGTCWRSRTSRVSVARLPWKNTTISSRPPDIEAARDREQHAPVAVGQVLPIDAAAQRGVAAPLAVDHVEEGDVLVRHSARDRETARCRTARAGSWQASELAQARRWRAGAAAPMVTNRASASPSSAQAGTQSLMPVVWPWVPACAGTNGGTMRRHSPQEMDRNSV